MCRRISADSSGKTSPRQRPHSSSTGSATRRFWIGHSHGVSPAVTFRFCLAPRMTPSFSTGNSADLVESVMGLPSLNSSYERPVTRILFVIIGSPTNITATLTTITATLTTVIAPSSSCFYHHRSHFGSSSFGSSHCGSRAVAELLPEAARLAEWYWVGCSGAHGWRSDGELWMDS